MTTQNQNVGTGGRNRGARRGSQAPDPALNIGAGLTAKDQTPAVTLTAQAATADGKPTAEAMEAVKLSRKTIDQAAKIVAGFHTANDELASLKAQTDAKRGGLSDIVFQLCKVAVADAPKPELRLAACVKVLDVAEAWERQQYQKANKLADLPPSKVALGSSWQTYKSQILKCVRVGLNPADFKNGTVFREAASNTGNKARGARQTAGKQMAAETMAGVLETAKLRTELSAAVADFVKHCEALDEELQFEYATRLHKLTKAAAKEMQEKDEAPDSENVATM